MMEEDEYRRGFMNALTAVQEEMERVESWIMDKEGNLGETTRAVLGHVNHAITMLEGSVTDMWRWEDRIMAKKEKD